jgi:hypothetical protein
VLGLTGAHEPLDLLVVVLGVEDHELVAVGVAGEVAEQRPRVDVLVLLLPHPLEPRPEVLLEQLVPLLALHAAPAPVELEQHVQVQVLEDVVQRHLDLADAPEWRRRNGNVRARA